MEKKDSGFKSRKLLVVLVAFMLIWVGGVMSTFWAAFAGQYATYVGGILGAAGLYLTGNVANDFLSGKVKSNVEIAHIKKTGLALPATEVVKDSPVAEISENDKTHDGE